MKKSKCFFIIMAIVYLAVAISGWFGWIKITENVLLGLSLSALLSAVSDILNNIGNRYIVMNEFDYIIRITTEFLADKISKNCYNTNSNVNVRNVKLNIECMSENYKRAVHPNDFSKRKFVKRLFILSQICFIISIAVFILVPFLPALSQQSISSFLTLIAFAAMSYNLHISEAITDTTEVKNKFMNNEQIIIQTAYPDFSNTLNAQLYYHEDYIAATSAQENDSNPHS